MLDPISDMLTRIRNAARAGHPEVSIPLSKLKLKIIQILAEKKFIESFSEEPGGKHKWIKVVLRYIKDDSGRVVSYIQGIERVSREGRRIYVRKNKISKTKGGYGFSVISTSRGVMADDTARKAGLGGEIICRIW